MKTIFAIIYIISALSSLTMLMGLYFYCKKYLKKMQQEFNVTNDQIRTNRLILLSQLSVAILIAIMPFVNTIVAIIFTLGIDNALEKIEEEVDKIIFP